MLACEGRKHPVPDVCPPTPSSCSTANSARTPSVSRSTCFSKPKGVPAQAVIQPSPAPCGRTPDRSRSIFGAPRLTSNPVSTTSPASSAWTRTATSPCETRSQQRLRRAPPPLRAPPWAVQVWRRKARPPQLALKRLQTVPASFSRGGRPPCTHADGGPRCAAFIHSVLGLILVVGVRKHRALTDGCKDADLTTRDPTRPAADRNDPVGKAEPQRQAQAAPHDDEPHARRRSPRPAINVSGESKPPSRPSKGRLGLERFAPPREQRAFRAQRSSAPALPPHPPADLNPPPKPPSGWPTWNQQAHNVRRTASRFPHPKPRKTPPSPPRYKP